VRIVVFEESFKKAKKALHLAIKKAKDRSWKDLLASIDTDPWGKLYKMVLGKMLPQQCPATEELCPEQITKILDGLFPARQYKVWSIRRRTRYSDLVMTRDEITRADA
jgi:hypothetical protein